MKFGLTVKSILSMTKEELEKASVVYCMGCKNCKGCKYCKGCIDCTYCTDCTNCTSCYKCTGIVCSSYVYKLRDFVWNHRI